MVAAYAVVTYPVLIPGNLSPLLEETGEFSGEAEDVELDESLDLIDTVASGPRPLPPRFRESVANKSVETRLILAADHYQRGPPAC